MNIIEEFTAIVEKEREVLPFLKKLDKAQKKELTPALKKLHKYYSEFLQNSNTSSYSPRGTQTQSHIISTGAFICCNQKDFEESTAFRVINKETLSPILPWYCPDWFNNYANSQAHLGGFNYSWYLELVDQGYLQLNRESVARLLPEYIFLRKEGIWKFEYRPENLLKRVVTLKEHIWYVFEYETNLHSIERYKQFSDDSAPGRWMKCLKDYSDAGNIDRQRLLTETLSCVVKNPNQSISNWFMDLFIYLEPSGSEILGLQSELLNTFNSPNSKPFNVVLKLFKNIAGETGFDVNAFLDNVSLVLTAETKTAVSSALTLLEKLSKLHPERQEQICMLTCQALIHQDNTLQLKAGRLIVKFCSPASQVLAAVVQPYYGSLLSEAKSLLANFSLPTGEVVIVEDMPGRPTEKATVIQMPENFEDFVFLASQAFEQNEPYHFDLLPACILRFQFEMTADNILKLMPAFQRAYKMRTSDWTNGMGYLDHMLAVFFIDYGKLLVEFFPAQAEPLKLMHASFLQKEEEKAAKWKSYQKKLSGTIKGWDAFTHSPGYKPHKQLLLNAFFLLERKIGLPLLSTPTHAPCWVSPVALVERLYLYQQANVIPADMDFQVAVARCMQVNQQDALQLAIEKLKGEYRALVCFVLGEAYQPQDSYKFKPVWLTAAISKNQPALTQIWSVFSNVGNAYLTGDFEWESIIEDYIWKQYDYQLKKEVDVPAKRKIIRIRFAEKQKPVSAVKGLLSKLIPATRLEVPPSIYEFICLNYDFLSGEHNDIKRLLYLNPNQVDILLAHIIHKELRFIDFSGENGKRLITYTLETLLTLNHPYGTMGHLFVASCMISGDKTIRTFAAELWIKGVLEETVESPMIGRMIGMHESIELAPLKRFTDLVISNMFQVSQKHNRSLEMVFSSCICYMDEPINGIKKLVEIYTEILVTNKSKVEDKNVVSKLNTWSKNESLAKTIQKLPGLKN